MSETLTETPAGTPESPPPGYEHFPNPEGSEVGVGGSEDTGFFAGGESPGLDAEPPGQQVDTPPAIVTPVAPEQVPAPEQQATEPTQQQPIPAKEDESRFEYWQSQANQTKRELDEIKGSQLHAIAQYVQKNPDMLDIVEEGIRGGPVTRPKGIPEKPIRPQRPDNYDSSESHDPETASGRYRAAYDDYQEKKDIYNDVRDEHATVQAQRDVESAELAKIKAGLMNEGGLNREEADDAMSVLFSRESMNPVTLSKLYRLMNAPSQDEIANQEKAKQLLAKKPGLEAPPPLATVPGEAPLPTTDEDDYHASIRAGAEMGGNLL